LPLLGIGGLAVGWPRGRQPPRAAIGMLAACCHAGRRLLPL